MAINNELSDNIDRALNLIYTNAIKLKASDIHLIPEINHIFVRFRVNGKFVDFKSISIENLDLIVWKIKILSNLKMEENRLPQDWSFLVIIDGKEVFLRVSTLPTIYWEKIVMRVLSTNSESIPLESLWIHKEQEDKIEKYTWKKNWLILIVWPTWSGKSTTILSIIKQFNPIHHNISTLEDPVEYRIKWVTHTQINHRIGFDFATWLRSILRQDPDIIMVWEIRDAETAKLSIEGAITWHMVLSTLHANSGANSIQRLISLKIDPNMIISALKLVISQQLIRKLCPHCKEKYTADKEVVDLFKKIVGNITPINNNLSLYKESEKWCEECNFSWLKWRIWIFEVFEVTKFIKNLILDWKSENEIEEQSEKDWLISIRQDWLLRVLDWDISLSELKDAIWWI